MDRDKFGTYVLIGDDDTKSVWEFSSEEEFVGQGFNDDDLRDITNLNVGEVAAIRDHTPQCHILRTR